MASRAAIVSMRDYALVAQERGGRSEIRERDGCGRPRKQPGGTDAAGNHPPAGRILAVCMRPYGVRRSSSCGIVLAALSGLVAATSALPLAAQANPYTDSLLARVRALGHAVPGALPIAVGYLSVLDDSGPESAAVEGAPNTQSGRVTPVFQIRYRQGWVMIDAAQSRAAAGPAGHYHQDNYDRIQTALRGARLIVATHEHSDHIDGVVRTPYLGELAPKTMLTTAQLHTLLSKPPTYADVLDSAQARRYIVFDYELVLPIAPGIVLIRAPGHTPGSQMVYVQLASGRELMLVGDVVWHHDGIDLQRQRPDSTSTQFGEDRTPIGEEIAWLKYSVASAGVALVVSHDASALEALARRGVLIDGLDLRTP
jgi:glyoxylase-like metal-dependent hydrolase (beta-lactamase superfamily II)